uniref:7TM GPCR serpentine receptor class x (Srx) domain-containing protein n=1 Tax=Panagrellus redivivus TaxID=6233 RepID=A0A7E4VI39_PANRE
MSNLINGYTFVKSIHGTLQLVLCGFSLSTSILYYLREWLHKKKTLSFIAFFHLFFDALFALSAWGPVLDDETTEQRARKEASDSLDRWIHEKSFQYVPEYFGRTRAFIFLVLCVLVCLFFTLIVIVIWFIVNVFILKKTSQTLDNYSSYLLITVLVQTAFCWAFAIENSGNVINVALHVFIFNSILDMLIMMYFVKPYKMYLIGILQKYNSSNK